MPGPSRATRVVVFLPAVFFAAAALASGGLRLLGERKPDHATREHAHRSAHGGRVQPAGRHHVELLLERGGGVRLFILGEDETELRPLPERELAAHVELAGSQEAIPLTLRAAPQPGDPPGTASLFQGELPPGGDPAHLTASVPSEGRRYRVRFDLGETHAEEGAAHPDPAAANAPSTTPMPQARDMQEEERLYAQPGGGYTAADIRVNGTRPPSVKYRGVPVRHDSQPQPGDRICPITRTKANPEFPWSVGGKNYRFCCPPCIDEFVQQARTDPASLPSPEAYVQR